MQSKKILLVVGSINQGGAEFQLLSLARLLQQRGFNIEVLALTDYDYFMPFIQEHQIPYSCIANKGSNIFRLWKAVRTIRSKKPGLVISYIKRVSQVAIIARLYAGFSFKLIISERTSLIKPWHDLFYFNLSHLADIITINSVSKLNYIKKRFPSLYKKAVFVPNIIAVEKYSSIEYKNVPDTLRIVFVGRISPEKNILNLIEAVKLLIGKGYPVQLQLTGSGNNKNFLTQVLSLIDNQELKHCVFYNGAVNEVKDIYSQADLLCLVSIFEGFSNVLSEAMCSGLPVVVSDIEENRFLVEDGKNGFLAKSETAESIAVAIEQFILLPFSERKKMSDTNRKKAKDMFVEETVFSQYKEIFTRIKFTP